MAPARRHEARETRSAREDRTTGMPHGRSLHHQHEARESTNGRAAVGSEFGVERSHEPCRARVFDAPETGDDVLCATSPHDFGQALDFAAVAAGGAAEAALAGRQRDERQSVEVERADCVERQPLAVAEHEVGAIRIARSQAEMRAHVQHRVRPRLAEHRTQPIGREGRVDEAGADERATADARTRAAATRPVQAFDRAAHHVADFVRHRRQRLEAADGAGQPETANAQRRGSRRGWRALCQRRVAFDDVAVDEPVAAVVERRERHVTQCVVEPEHEAPRSGAPGVVVDGSREQGVEAARRVVDVGAARDVAEKAADARAHAACVDWDFVLELAKLRGDEDPQPGVGQQVDGHGGVAASRSRSRTRRRTRPCRNSDSANGRNER